MAIIELKNFYKDKYGVKYKFPGRKCEHCAKYPCMKELSILSSNFAAYGCINFR